MTSAQILIVEDELLVAADLEATLQDLGHAPVGIATDAESALLLAARKPDLALVDLNLRDGETGAIIGERISREFGIAVLFVTANPRRLGDGVPGAIGVLTKPCDETHIASAVDYALMVRRGEAPGRPPAGLRVFEHRAP